MIQDLWFINQLPIGFAQLKLIYDGHQNPSDYEFILVNTELEKIFNVKNKDLSGKRLSEVSGVLFLQNEHVNKHLHLLTSNNRQIHFEATTIDGQKNFRIKSALSEEGFVSIFVHEISQNNKLTHQLVALHKELDEHQLYLNTIANYTFDWEVWENEHGNLVFVSKACERISGYSQKEFLSNPHFFSDIIINEDKPIWHNHRHDINENQGFHTKQFRIRHKNGSVIWIEHVCASVFEDGRFLGYRSNNRDITRTKQVEQLLKENEAQFIRIIETLPISLSIITLDGTVLYANQRGLDLFDLSRDVIGTKTTLALWVNPEERKVWLQTLQEQGLVKDFEMHVQTKNGKTFWAMASGLIIQYQNQTCVLSTHHDITERKILEDQLKKREEQYRLLFENAVESIVVIQDQKIKICNPMVQELTGYDEETLLSKPFLTFIHPQDQPAVIQYHKDRIAGKDDGKKNTFRILRKNGDVRWVDSGGIRIVWEDEPATLNFLTDITARKRTEDALIESEEKYRMLTEYASDVIWVLNLTQGKFTYISPSIKQLRGLSQEEALSEKLEDALTPQSLIVVQNAIQSGLSDFIKNPHDPNFYIHEIQQPCKNGNIIWVEVSTKFRHNKEGEIEVLGVSRNIDERKKSEEQVLFLSYYDQLTGLYNRRFFEEELKRLSTKKRLPISLIMADVNGLKLINDAFGHHTGDRVLKVFAEILRKEFRDEDIVARTGGDEFVILLPNTSESEADRIIQRIQKKIKDHKIDEIQLSASFGYATKNHIEDNLEHLFKQAEDFMYRRKLLESNSMKSETIQLITKSLYEKDPSEQAHNESVSDLCKRIGKALDLPQNEINDLGLLGILHDIGKIGINEKILLKPTQLDTSERKQIERHPEIGYQILRSASEFAHIAEYVLCHHERIDGTGYPRGLSGEQIPLQARILSIAEAYQFMTTEHLFKQALSPMQAEQELQTNAGTQFDPKIVQVFVERVLNQPK